MCWTSQPNFGLVPHPPVDGSMLIIGNRGGLLSFLRCDTEGKGAVILETVAAAQTWITNIAASEWTTTSNSTSSYVAYGAADGSVGLLRVEEKLVVGESPGFSFVPEYQVELTITKSGEEVASADKAGLTALEWISTSHGAVGVVYASMICA